MKQLAALLAAICLILLSTTLAQGRHKVHYDEIKAITLRKGQFTAARRLDPIPQLKCTSGACNLYEPDVVQCQNMGSDGKSAQWKCEAQMNEKFKFGKVKVLCEGYDRPGDIYVLPGSCGLEYELLLTDAGKAFYQEQNGGIPRGYYRNEEEEYDGNWNGFRRRSDSFDGDALSTGTIILIVGAVLLILFFCIKAPQNRAAYTASQASRPQTTSSSTSSSSYSRMYPDAQQPPYNPEYNDGYGYTTSSRPSTTYSTSSYSNSDSGRPGFWSGAAMGAAAGYAMGRATAPSSNNYGSYTTHPNNSSSYGSYFTNNSSSGSYTNMYPNTSSSSHSNNNNREREYTATGYADTETR